MPRLERVYFSIDRCLLRSYAEIMNKGKMITESLDPLKQREVTHARQKKKEFLCFVLAKA